jgi:hypothetical protein
MKRALAAVVVVAPSVASAAAPSVIAEVDRGVIGVGDNVRYTISIRGSGVIDVSSVSAGSIDGFEVVAKQSMPSESIVFNNGKVEHLITFNVTFVLRGNKIGKHTLGPGRVVMGGKTITTPAQKVEVVAAAKKPKSPFDDFEEEEPPPPPPTPPSDPLAKVDAPPTDPDEALFFTRVVPATKKAIVGEQVTLKLFVYARNPPKVFLKRPPVLTDFRHVPLGGVDKVWQKITIGSDDWLYGTLEAFAAFPLRAGKLTIGPAVVETVHELAFGKSNQHDFESLTTEVEVVEPPTEGRPSGYVLGDVVGDLLMDADVAPRTVTDGHALVTLHMKGAGRLDPLRPQLPTPPGVTWTNTGDETKTRIDALTVVGERKLQIDAKFDRTGELDLGDAVMHVWDPKRKGYVTVRTNLGKVRVDRPAESTALPGAAAPATLPPPRGTMGRSGEGTSLADRAWTWAIVAGAPLSVIALQAMMAAARRRRERLQAREIDPGEQARRALAEGAHAKALDRAIEAATGVRARGLTKSELARTLRATKLDRELVTDILEVFEALENARFAGGKPPSAQEIKKLVDEVLAS